MSASSLQKTREWKLSLPLAIFFIFFFVAPLLLMFFLSLFASPEFEEMGIAQYRQFFADNFNISILWDTVWLGIQTTLVCLLLAFPLAILYTKSSNKVQTLIMFAIIMPLLTSVVVRTFAWLVILGRTGIVNTMIIDLGLASAPIKFLYTNGGVVLALAQIQIPLMAMPLITSLSNIDRNLAEASESLGANAWRTFFKVTLPLALPGVVAGSLLVFAAAATAFVTQSVIGGGRLIYMPQYIYQQAISLQNWPFAAAISIVFTASVIAIMYFFNRLGQSKAMLKEP